MGQVCGLRVTPCGLRGTPCGLRVTLCHSVWTPWDSVWTPCHPVSLRGTPVTPCGLHLFQWNSAWTPLDSVVIHGTLWDSVSHHVTLCGHHVDSVGLRRTLCGLSGTLWDSVGLGEHQAECRNSAELSEARAEVRAVPPNPASRDHDNESPARHERNRIHCANVEEHSLTPSQQAAMGVGPLEYFP